MRADLMSEIKPLLFWQSISTVKTPKEILELLEGPLLIKSTISTCLTTVERNAIEFAMYNVLKEDLSFKNRICIKFGASYISSTLSSIIMHERISLSNFVVVPMYQGIYHTLVYMITNSQETKDYFKKEYPAQYKACTENKYISGSMSLIRSIYDFINSPRKPYKELLEYNGEGIKIKNPFK